MRVENVLVLMLWLGCARACREPNMHISGVAGNTRSFNQQYLGNILEAHYGDNLNIFCSSINAINIRINLQGNPARQVNKTTLQLSVENPVIGVYHYTCTDVETTCAVKLRVRVLPVVTVLSPNVHLKSTRFRGTTYFVPIDEDYEVVCYGNPKLRINNLIAMEVINVNETTIKSKKLRGTEYSRRVYYCANQASIAATSPNIEILFDYVPAATNLWCTEHEWKIFCSWTVFSMDTIFTLFYIDKNGYSIRIFEDFSGSKKIRSCDWNLGDMQLKHDLAISGDITLIVQACNNIYCSNQTHVIDRKSIIKTGPPQDLKLSRKTSHSAVVTWRGPWTAYFDKVPVEYKLTYRLPGVKDLNGSSSQFTCDHQALRYLEKCKGELNLPCPGALYEVQLYVKFTSTPCTNDAYWSDPARVTFWTNPHNSSDTIDPACLKEPELIDNKYVAVHEIKKLERSFRKEGSALQVKVKSLEHKLDKIKELCRELSLNDCEHFVLSLV